MSIVVLKWEYLVVEISTVDPTGTTQLLNGFGDKGWELVAIRNQFYYFKKPDTTAHVV
jgi:hypothetical protein